MATETSMETSMEMMPEMEDLAAAFAASVTMSGSSTNNNNSNILPAPRLPAAASTSTSLTGQEMKMVRHMEDLVAAFAAASVSLPALPHNTAPSTVPPSHTTTTTTTTATEEDGREPAKGEEACVVRVRFPDGRVACRSFGAGRPVAALFRYCRSVLLGAGGPGRRAFRIVKLAGGSSEEVRAGSASFRDLGLHHCTLHVVLA
ncbi:hypothetical protein ZWY2020_041419 [Hordeum vulgare]|nr:hypothetical protein ZWY2020_041419 [Hordeum vulgare]